MASDGETSCANDPNFAVIYSFLKVFGKLYGLEVPTITKLQEFVEDTQEVPEPLKELHLRLLRRALRSLHSNRWEKGMIKFCHQQGHHQEAWEIERFSYKKASTQVKLKVLKILLEYQFTCHPKFKGAVNAITCKDLRLDPIGRDKNGCVYWLQVDHEANLCLYKEDQDEETWQLVARTREELVKVIGQLKSGDEVCPLVTTNANEDSSGAENSASKPEIKSEEKPEVEEDNEEEFLSPESESDHEDVETIVKDQPPDNQPKTDTIDNNTHEEQASHSNVQEKQTSQNEEENSEVKDESVDKTEEEKDRTIENIEDNSKENVEDSKSEETKEEALSNVDEDVLEKCEQINTKEIEEISVEEASVYDVNNEQNNKTQEQSIGAEEQSIEDEEQSIEEDNRSIVEENRSIVEENRSIVEENQIIEEEKHSIEVEKQSIDAEKQIIEEEKQKNNGAKSVETKENEEVGEAIEEPVMHVAGEGSGVDCESFFIGEEITETVMYFYGEGWGYDNDTGNPEVIEENEAHSDEENDNDEPVNGEHELTNTKTIISKGVKLKTVNKRSLKKQSNDGSDMKPDVKKPCVRDVDTCNSSIDNDKRDTSSNDKSITDTECPNKSNIKKSRGKVKKNAIVRKMKINDGKEAINSVSETDNCQDKTSIIEKRKSSVSSVDHEEGTTENDKEKSPEKESKVEDPLPPKKLRLEPTPENDVDATHSKDAVSDSVENDNKKDCVDDPISKRKKIKATKGKFKRKNIKNSKSNNGEKANDVSEKKACKSLKRSLVDSTMSDKNKTESQSESEEDEPITSGKRLKIKPKKIITSSRKKVEAKLMDKHSSDESEEETLYSLAGKKTTKKLTKKKTKPKAKEKCNKRENEPGSENESDLAPVRQSRRIAQQKIKEEAERRHQEEIALRELKMIHKKKGKDDDEEEWVGGSAGSSSEDATRRTKRKVWKECDSTGPEPDSESEVDVDPPHHDPDPDYVNKSDHEFSPESDLESGEPAEPLKRARTLQEEKDEGFCKACGSAEQPEWILLCDACDAGYHASCLKPMLFLVPEGDWFCPPCNHDKLIKCLESELVKYDELLAVVEEERARRKLEEPEPVPEQEPQGKQEDDDEDSESSGSWSGSSGGVYRLRARRQVPVSLRAQEYDRLISAAIKEEYVEPTTSAGNQGRGKDISTIIEAAEEEKMKAEREAQEQGKPIEMRKSKKKQRRKPRKLNSLDVPSEDDDETDEDFKDTGGASSSEDISSSASRDSSNDSRSSDSLPIRRTGRTDKKERPKMTESSPEVKKKKKGLFQESSSESAGAKEWSNSKKSKSSTRDPHRHSKEKKRRRRGHGHHKHGLTQYDAAGNVIRARVTYGGLSGPDSDNDWSPKHRTRQKKINYTEMPNTESEDEMHKSSGKHMPDSSDEFKISSDDDSDSDSDRAKRKKEEESEEKRKALSDLVKKTAVVPLEKLPEDVTKAKTEELQVHLSNLKEAANSPATNSRPTRGKGSRGGRGSRGPRGRGRGLGGAPRAEPPTDDALAKLVGVKIKELGQDGVPATPSQMEKEKRRQEREAKLAEKEAKKLERVQKREEKEKLKEQKAKEREEKRLARLAMQETKRIKKEKDFGGMGGGEMRINMFVPPDYNNHRPPGPHGPMGSQGPAGPHGPPGPHGPHGPHGPPRLQVRAELRGMMADDRGPLGPHQHNALREGTLSVAGSPQPFRPVSEEPSIITRMPHMLNQHYNRGPMVYGPGGTGAGGPGGGFPPRGVFPPRGQMPPGPGGYYRLPPHYAHNYPPHMQGPGGSSSPMQHPGQPPSNMGHGFPYRPGPPGAPQLAPDARSMQPHQSHPPGISGPQGKIPGAPGTSTILQSLGQSHPSHMQAHNLGPRGPNPPTNLAQLQNMGPGRPPGLGPGGPHPMNPGGPHPGMNTGGPHSNIGGPHQIIRDQNPQSLPPGAPQVPSSGLGPSVSGVSGAPGPPTSQPNERDMPIKIKAEVKTEPEYRSPPGSPVESAEPARHPKIKVTEGGARRPRFPLGPYAPHLHYPPYPGPPGPAPPVFTDRNKIQYGPQGPHEAPTRSGSPPRGFFPPRGYPPPLLRGPPSLNGAPYRPPPAHSPHHPSPAQSPQQFPARSAPSPSHCGPPGPPHSPPRSPTQAPHHPGMPPRPPSVKSPHHLPLHRPPQPRSPHNIYPSQSPHHPGLHRPSPIQSPHHQGLPPAHSPHHSGLPQMQSPHHPGIPPTQSFHQSGAPPAQSPHHPGPPNQSPHHLGAPPGQSPHHPGIPPSQSGHRPGTLPTQSPHHPGIPPSQSGHRPGTLPTQSPHHPGIPPAQSPHQLGAAPAQSPHHPGAPPAQSPHHLGAQPAQSPHHPGIPPTQSPHHLGAPPAQSPHHPGAPPAQSPHHPGAPPSQSPHHPGIPPTPSPHHLGAPSAQSPHHPRAPPAQSPHHPGAPPLQSPHHPGAPSAQSPHHPGMPTTQSAHHPGIPPTQSPHHPGIPPTQSPHHPGAPPAQSPHYPGPPQAQSPHHPGASPAQSPHHTQSAHHPGIPPTQSAHHPGLPSSQPIHHPSHQVSHHPGLPPSQSPHHPGLPLPQTSQHPGLPPARSPHHLHPDMVGHRPALLQPLGSGSPPRNISYPFYGDRRPPQPIPRDSLPPKPNSPRRIDSEHDRIVPKLEMPVSLDRVKVEPNREEGSVFGGLVSYFSSQHEDDIDG